MSDLLILYLFKWDHAIKHSMEFYGDMLINVAFTEKPFPVFAGFDNILKKCMDFKTFENVNSKAFL